MPVAREKFPQLQRSRRMPRPQQDHVPISASDQLQAAQDKRAQQDLAQLRVLRDQRSKRVALHFDKLARLGDAPAHQGPLPGDHRNFTREFARTVGGDLALSAEVWLHDFHASREQHKKWNRRYVRLKKNFPALDIAHATRRANAVNLSLTQDGKRLRARIQGAGQGRGSHIPFSHPVARALAPVNLTPPAAPPSDPPASLSEPEY